MGTKTQLIKVISDSLRSVDGIRRVRVGDREELRSYKDYPIINIAHIGGTENWVSAPKTKTDSMRLQITLGVTKPSGADNNDLYFDAAQTGGALVLFEDVLNALDAMNGTAVFDNQEYDYSITEDGGKIFYDLTVTAQTQSFQEGAR
ncbi:hypothetical protein NO1_1689 [Candidatus Termititenax aidoneus]|uniref:Uncharacterized protein n=1 Tax=Termititenax aidoneus TaxID=2218524 RepID=A0A388TCH1_TERA1|nr:hypothetical protein NO1_1689 [Candidatus Termititenax aidoneus]